MGFLTIALVPTLASAVKFTHCCVSESKNRCDLVEAVPNNPPAPHGCFGFEWENGGALDDFEYITSMQFTGHRNASAKTSAGRILPFGFRVEDTPWLRFTNLNLQVFKADLGRHVVALKLNEEKPQVDVTGVITVPMPVGPMDCEDGKVMRCPLDPMYSEITYTVADSDDAKCTSPGSWDTVRTFFEFRLSDCPTRELSNASFLKKKVVLEPKREQWYIHNSDHTSIPNDVECTCSYAADGDMTVHLVDNGTWAEVLTRESMGNHSNLTVTRITISQGKFRITLNASTLLDALEIQDCDVDAVDYDGRHLGQKIPLVRGAKKADSYDEQALDIKRSRYEYLKQLDLDIQDNTQYQLVLLNGITSGAHSLMFRCTIRVCYKDDLTRCQVGQVQRRLAPAVRGRKLQEDPGSDLEEEQKVVLSDSECQGLVMPDIDTSRPGVKGCPNETNMARSYHMAMMTLAILGLSSLM